MSATVIGEGNSNVVIALDVYYFGKVIRICKRFLKVSLNNAYILKNQAFQSRLKDEFDEISNSIDDIKYEKIDNVANKTLFGIIEKVLIDRNVAVDEDHIIIAILQNHLDFVISEKQDIDYYTKVYNNFLVEFKPKWAKMSLYDYKKYISYPKITLNDKEISFCRNCKHISASKPQLLCYNGCKSLKGINQYNTFVDYLNTPENIIQRIYKLQTKLQKAIVDDNNIDLVYINALIALRDVSVFYNMKTSTAVMIDMDFKDIGSIKDFKKKMQKEWNLLE